MIICQPVEKEQGIDNVLHGHFRSAPRFVVYDTKTNEAKVLGNQFKLHDHNVSKPIRSLKEQLVEVAIVGGLDRCTLMKLQNSGFKVYQAAMQTLEDNLAAFEKGELKELTMQNIRRGYPC